MEVPYRQIRAEHTGSTVTVYQAYGPRIGRPAGETGRFPAAFKHDRMTWIKPSFRWMMYRSGWATKPGQEHVLAVRLRRDGFEWALRHAALSHYDRNVHAGRDAWAATLHRPVRVQWDPERDLYLRPLPHRSLQVGLSGEAVRRYTGDWITGIDDVTGLVREIRELVGTGRLDEARDALPVEHPYPVPADVAARLGADPGTG